MAGKVRSTFERMAEWGRRAIVVTSAGIAALAVTSAAQGFVPAGQFGWQNAIVVAITNSFPYYGELCGSGELPVVIGLSKNESFRQIAHPKPDDPEYEQSFGVVLFVCDAGSTAFPILVQTATAPIVSNSALFDVSNLTGWRWTAETEDGPPPLAGATFNKTTADANGDREPVSICVEEPGESSHCTAQPQPVVPCPIEVINDEVINDTTLLTELEGLLNDSIGAGGDVAYAWRFPLGHKQFPGAPNNPLGIKLYVEQEQDAHATCAIGPQIVARDVSVQDQARFPIIVDGTCIGPIPSGSGYNIWFGDCSG